MNENPERIEITSDTSPESILTYAENLLKRIVQQPNHASIEALAKSLVNTARVPAGIKDKLKSALMDYLQE